MSGNLTGRTIMHAISPYYMTRCMLMTNQGVDAWTKDVDDAGSSSDILISTLHVMSRSWSLLTPDLVTWDCMPFASGGGVHDEQDVEGFCDLGSIWINVWCCFWHFWHFNIDLHTLAKCPGFKQLTHSLFSFKTATLFLWEKALNLQQSYKGC